MVKGQGDMADELVLDVVCPVYKNFEQITYLLDSIKKQKGISINRIVCPLTLSNELIDNKIESYFKENNICYFKVNKDEFSHSLTREKAIRNYCQKNIVVLLSQDIKFFNEYSIYNLASSIDGNIVYSYGRQICSNRSIERYIREKNYPKESYIVSKEDIERLQLMAFFASDAFSALDRNVFLKLNSYNGFDVMMNEDQLYSKIILDAGYKKRYVAEAIVEHSHKYKLRNLYERYYQTGIFYKKVKIFDEYKSTDSGIKLAFYVLKQALKNFDIPVLLRWLPDMTSRYLGMRKGRKTK